jgi:hypothetical protein
MDELTFRRTIYAEPNTTDPEVIQAAKNDSAKQAFWDEVKALDAQISAAFNIAIPENFAEKLILRQGMDEFTQHRKKRPWYLAMAASIAMVAGISYLSLIAGNNGLANDVFAHVNDDYMNKEISMNGQNVSIDAINKKMATFNGQLSEEIGEILSANYCYLDKIKSLHMIIKGEKGLISLFIVPGNETKGLQEEFNNQQQFAASFLLESAKIIIVGDDKKQVSRFQKIAKSAFTF